MKSNVKALASLEKEIAAHEVKLAEYIKDSWKFDNLGHLKNALSDAIRQKNIQTRINHLQHDIKVLSENILKTINGQ